MSVKVYDGSCVVVVNNVLPLLSRNSQLNVLINGLVDKFFGLRVVEVPHDIYSGGNAAPVIEHVVIFIWRSLRCVAITTPSRNSYTHTVTTYLPAAGAIPDTNPVFELMVTLLPSGLLPLNPCPYGTLS